MIKLHDVSKSYIEGEQICEVIKKINLSIKEKEVIVVLGASGSGKSTLLNLIGGLDKPDEGEIFLAGENCSGKSDREMSMLRREMFGFVFQSFNLIPVLSVWENITIPIKLSHKKIEKEYIEELLKLLGIFEKRDSLPSKLSGGQQQRVAIARALANKPRIVLADEPTGNLDSENGESVVRLLLEGVKKYGQTLIIVTHNMEITKYADRVVYMQDGKIREKVYTL